jgi:hypothetical protein
VSWLERRAVRYPEPLLLCSWRHFGGEVSEPASQLLTPLLPATRAGLSWHGSRRYLLPAAGRSGLCLRLLSVSHSLAARAPGWTSAVLFQGVSKTRGLDRGNGKYSRATVKAAPPCTAVQARVRLRSALPGVFSFWGLGVEAQRLAYP